MAGEEIAGRERGHAGARAERALDELGGDVARALRLEIADGDAEPAEVDPRIDIRRVIAGVA